MVSLVENGRCQASQSQALRIFIPVDLAICRYTGCVYSRSAPRFIAKCETTWLSLDERIELHL
ncbi:hypothetical protein MPER_01738 [Moniliophthora perniciosa FA553]|nr:hypothetical protein MPER_01738 [Moniliophthora perniciosa FA553]